VCGQYWSGLDAISRQPMLSSKTIDLCILVNAWIGPSSIRGVLRSASWKPLDISDRNMHMGMRSPMHMLSASWICCTESSLRLKLTYPVDWTSTIGDDISSSGQGSFLEMRCLQGPETTEITVYINIQMIMSKWWEVHWNSGWSYLRMQALSPFTSVSQFTMCCQPLLWAGNAPLLSPPLTAGLNICLLVDFM